MNEPKCHLCGGLQSFVVSDYVDVWFRDCKCRDGAKYQLERFIIDKILKKRIRLHDKFSKIPYSYALIETDQGPFLTRVPK
jgi:hypothetical protein